jgi:hypothetical protein
MGQGLDDIRLLGRECGERQGTTIHRPNQDGDHNDELQKVGNHVMCNNRSSYAYPPHGLLPERVKYCTGKVADLRFLFCFQPAGSLL